MVERGREEEAEAEGDGERCGEITSGEASCWKNKAQKLIRIVLPVSVIFKETERKQKATGKL